MTEENRLAALVYLAIRNHLLIIGKKVVDLDIKAVKAAMDIYQVEDRERATCYEKVRRLFFARLREEQSG